MRNVVKSKDLINTEYRTAEFEEGTYTSNERSEAWEFLINKNLVALQYYFSWSRLRHFREKDIAVLEDQGWGIVATQQVETDESAHVDLGGPLLLPFL